MLATGSPNRTGPGRAWGHATADHPPQAASATGPQGGLLSSPPVSVLTFLSGWTRARAADTSPWTSNLHAEASTGPQGHARGVWEEHTARLSLQRQGAASLGAAPPLEHGTCEMIHTPHWLLSSGWKMRHDRGLCGHPVGGVL